MLNNENLSIKVPSRIFCEQMMSTYLKCELSLHKHSSSIIANFREWWTKLIVHRNVSLYANTREQLA